VKIPTSIHQSACGEGFSGRRKRQMTASTAAAPMTRSKRK
jgi:hypothetical protein